MTTVEDVRRVLPSQGGCWFCNQAEPADEMRFSVEFDTNVHALCLASEMMKGNPEAEIIAREFDVV